ncbi:MAG TPA: membrane protein insertase YidC, partial [Candidatus Kapabacteria bacterium]|nr:membrane protein insertase YidC [Candidatus Kapabacteria bacterium]
MELRRTLLIVAMAVVGYMLILTWQKDYGAKPVADAVAATSPAVAPTVANGDTPAVPAAPANGDVPAVPSAPASTDAPVEST